MKAKIENWFKGNQNYQEGLTLLIATGARGTMLKRLQRGESKSNKEKLAWELCEAVKLDRSITKTVNLEVANSTASVMEVKKNKLGPVEPEIITQIKLKLQELINLRAQIHGKMAELSKSNDNATIESRKEYLEKIGEITDRIDVLYDAKETFFREKKLPDPSVLSDEPVKQAEEKKPASEFNPVELITKRNNLRSNITKATGKLKKAITKAQKTEAQEKLNKLTSELEEVEAELKKIQK